METDKRLITVFFIRHLKSMQEKVGYGKANPKLASEGLDATSGLVSLLGSLDHSPCLLFAGTEEKHSQTIINISKELIILGYETKDNLNPIYSGRFSEQPGKITEKELHLDRFQPDEDGYCYVELIDNRTMKFNPVTSGINPFDPLYSHAYFNKDLREVVFGNNSELPSFDDIKSQVVQFQSELVQMAKQTGQHLNIVAVSSCSPAGFNLEYSVSGTIGLNLYRNFPKRGNPMFPLDHDEVIILGYTEKDLEAGSEKLSPVTGRVKIEHYLQTLQ